MNKDLLQETQRRTIQYRFEDGIVEIVTGGMLFLAGLYFYIQAVMANTPLADWLGTVLVLVMLGGWSLMQFLIRSLKERITIARTGFVAYRSGETNRGVLVVAAVGVAVLTAGLLAFSQGAAPTEWSLLPIFTGVVIAAVLGLIGAYTALPRFYVLAATSMGLGLAFAASRLSNDLATAAYCGALGLVFVASGGFSLSQYLRQNPVHTEAGDDK